MWSNILYYLSTVILTVSIILYIFMNKTDDFGFNHKCIGIFVLIITSIFLLGNAVLYKRGIDLPFGNKQNYIYVQPGKKPIVIGWQNPLAQEII